MSEAQLLSILNDMSNEAERLMPTIEKLAEFSSENEVPGLSELLGDVMSYVVWVRSALVGTVSDVAG